jgi:hypothetical protein
MQNGRGEAITFIMETGKGEATTFDMETISGTNKPFLFDRRR